MLQDAGIVTTVRKTRGDDIDAACGQLAGEVKDRTRVGRAHRTQRTVMLHPACRAALGTPRSTCVMTTTRIGRACVAARCALAPLLAACAAATTPRSAARGDRAREHR